MKILVTVKRVIDPYVKIRIKSDKTTVETEQVKMSINPFDEIALEEAVRLLEQSIATEVVVMTIGSDNHQETLRQALALGANRGILIRSEHKYCPLNTAKIIQQVILEEKPDLVLMGKQSIDGDNNQTPQMLAGLLEWPQATFASKIQFEKSSIQVTREVDNGLETVEVKLPAIVSVDLRLNEPRYASLPNIMKAKQKSIKIIELDEMKLELNEHLQVLSIEAPPVRGSGLKLSSVNELLDRLQSETDVL